MALLALGLPAVAAPAATASDGAPRHPVAARLAPAAATVTVSGEGSASAEPDMAVLGVGVEATAKTAKEAQAAQSSAAGKLLDALRAQGIAAKDIHTQNVSLGPVYDYSGGAATLTGYRAAQSFSVQVRALGKTGAVLQAVTDSAGDAGRVDSVVFDLADRGPLRAAAREAAFAEARGKAQHYARLSGQRLGRLVSLSENGTGFVAAPPPMAADMAPGGSGAVPVSPGEIKATSSVTAVYELG